MRRHIWAGLDVGAETTSFCVINDTGEVLQEGSCSTSLMSVDREIRWLRRRKFATVGLEAATGTHLARGLRSRGYNVDMYEARQLSKFLRVRRNKTDANDAIGIAEVGRLGQTLVGKVHLKSLECQSLQSRLTIRQHLIRQRVGVVSLLCRQLEHYGGRISRSSLSKRNFSLRVQAEITKLFGRTPNPLTDELRRLLGAAESLLAYQRTVDQDLYHAAADIEVCRRFMAIPGVGCLTALTFYAAVSEPGRFERSSDIGSYFGLTPRIHQSGLTCRLGRISKMGNRAARNALVCAAKGFMRWGNDDDPLRKWAGDIELRRGQRKARIAVARKLGIIMLAMWKRGEEYQPMRHHAQPETGRA
jgi:transposase